MMPDLKEIKVSREGRSYRTWWSQPHPGTKYGLKYNANWVIFPTKYEWHMADPANKWICPIRDCRNIFPTIKKLEIHTMNLHGGLQLNDNRDGTTSVVGAWNSDYLQVVSQKRPAPGAPPPAKPCLPLAGHLEQLHHQKLSPPSSPPQNEVSGAVARSPRSQTEDTVLRMVMCNGRDDRDPTMPAETPITARLETAKKLHRQRQMEVASLSTATGVCSSTTGEQREMSVTNNDDNDEDDAVMFDDDDHSLFVQDPTTPTRSSSRPGAILQKPVMTPSTQSVATPVNLSSRLCTQPGKRSSERLALRRLSSSGSASRLDSESPSSRQSTRLHNMMDDASSSRTPLRPSRTKLAARPRRMSDKSSNGRSSAEEYMTPLTGQKRRNSHTNCSGDEGDGQDMETLLATSPTGRAAKRRGILRLQIHAPERAAVGSSNKTKSGCADMFSIQNTLSGKSPYLSPPSSQEPVASSSSPGCGDSCSHGCSRPTILRMEDWEISPGKITATPSLTTPSTSSKIAGETVISVLKHGAGVSLKSPDLAYSCSYLTQPSPVPMSPGIGAHVVRINCGDQYRFPTSGSGARSGCGAIEYGSNRTSQKKEWFCFVAAGKALVKMSRPTTGEGRPQILAFEQDFAAGRNSMFRVAYDMECLVSNFHDAQLDLHVMEIVVG